MSVDKAVIEWVFAAGGALLLFFLGLGVKDIKDKMTKVDRLCIEIERMKVQIHHLEQGDGEHIESN